MYPNVIIAGTNKAGTTSLFRYLADHPEVCPSAVKEVRHFTRSEDPFDAAALRRYASQFEACRGQPVRLEASPDYLTGGQAVAAAIQRLLPDVQLIFVLREPLGRLVSGYRRRHARQDPELAGLTLQAYLDRLAAPPPGSRAARDMTAVSYAPLLAPFLDRFPAERVAVRFFDDLSADSHGFVVDLCRFIDVDPGFFADYRFAVENKTRAVRHPRLQRWAHRLNMAAEPLLNSAPALRRTLRRAYNALNEDRHRAAAAEPIQLGELRGRFADSAAELRELLATERPEITLPPWVAAETYYDADMYG